MKERTCRPSPIRGGIVFGSHTKKLPLSGEAHEPKAPSDEGAVERERDCGREVPG